MADQFPPNAQPPGAMHADDSCRHRKIFIASPGDVNKERDIAEEVIKQWNIAHGEREQLCLDAIRWESHGAPELGDRVQGILNKQLVDQCHAAIGIFWTRIGTDTGVAPGGAVEEIERLREMGKPVMVYFSDVPFQRKMVDLEQVKKLDDYRESLQKQGLVWQYETVEEFRTKLSNHLAMEVPKWFDPINERNPTAVFLSHQADDAELLRRYQATLQEQLGDITLMGSSAFGHLPLKLSETFVSLSLSGSSLCEKRITPQGVCCCEGEYERSSSPETVMKVVFNEQQYRLLLIIGDPGSGKTTLLKYYALSCLDADNRERFGFHESVNIFFLPLRELQKKGKGYASLEENLVAWSKKQDITITKKSFTQWLAHPSTLMLLDGLDEISNVDDRIAACKWITATVRRLTQAKFVVTSRTTGYRKGDGIEIRALHLRADILDFSKDQQAVFLHRWFKAAFCAEIRSDNTTLKEWQQKQDSKATKKADAIFTFLNGQKNKSLQLLAGVPLLLQIMAMLWKERNYLPTSRLKLYDAALNYMLGERDIDRGKPPLLDAENARRVLSPVSLFMQEELKKDEIDRLKMHQQMQVQLDTLYNSLPSSDFCRDLVDRAGLLVEYGDNEYVFRHKSFREYMAGVQLVKNMRYSDALDKLVIHFGDDWWTEVFRFFIAHVDDAELFDSFIQKLFDVPMMRDLTQKQQDLLITLIEEAPQRKLDALQRKLLDRETTPNQQRYLLECLKHIGTDKAHDVVKLFIEIAPEYVNYPDIFWFASDIVGHVLGTAYFTHVLIDPDTKVLLNPYEQHARYICIPAGKFIYSVTKKPIEVDERYFAKNTVTNQQYRRFINYLEGNEAEYERIISVVTYEVRLQVIASGIEKFSEYLKGEPSLAKRFVSEEDTNKRLNNDNQPVVGVSWYAARAYCLWLSLLASNGEKVDLYRLPADEEWEWAAGGQRYKPDEVLEARYYPWIGEEITSQHANFNLNEGQTTPVGRYPKGATPEGLYDMAGNVWEWTESWWDEETSSHRALRGGSWYGTAECCRSAFRNFGTPADWGYDVGFRLVFVP